MAASEDELSELSDLWQHKGPEPALVRVWALIEQDPEDAMAMAVCGRILNELDRHEEGKAQLRQALVINPKLSYAMSGLAILAQERGDLIDAARLFTQAIELNETAHRLVMLADVQKRLGDRVRARASLERAIELPNVHQEAYVNLGYLIEDEEPEESLRLYRRALRVDAHNAAAISRIRAIERK